MITIWKLTISTFRLGITKLSKISFTTAVDRNAVIKLHKSEKVCWICKTAGYEPSTVWKIVKKLQETGNTLDRPGRGRKLSGRFPNFSKTQKKSREETLAEAAGPWSPQPAVWANPPHQVLRDHLVVKSFKMLHRQELTANHVIMRARKCKKIFQEMANGTLPNLVFTDEKKFDIQQVVNQHNDRVWTSSTSTERRIVTRRQIPQSVTPNSAACHGLGPLTHPRSPSPGFRRKSPHS